MKCFQFIVQHNIRGHLEVFRKILFVSLHILSRPKQVIRLLRNDPMRETRDAGCESDRGINLCVYGCMYISYTIVVIYA